MVGQNPEGNNQVSFVMVFDLWILLESSCRVSHLVLE